MRLENYVGVEQPALIIEKETDLYPALDHLQNLFLAAEMQGPADLLSKFMDEAEKSGFGDFEDIDEIQYL